MPKKAKNSGIWAYLDALGVLEKGTEEEIKSAKKAYRKQYLLNYKRNQRASKPEFTVSLSHNNGEYSRIVASAKKHKRSVPTFIRLATLAYINKAYIVPDRLQMAQLELLLSQCLNEIKKLVQQKEKFFWERERKFEKIEKHIENLESDIKELFSQPYTIEELVIKEIKKNPELTSRIITIISSLPNDYQNQIT